MNCPADPCNAERCPIRQNDFQDLRHHFAVVEDEVMYLRNFLDELVMGMEDVPLTTAGIAQLRVRKDKARLKLDETERAVPSGTDGPLGQFMEERKAKLRKEIEEVEQQIGQMRRGEVIR